MHDSSHSENEASARRVCKKETVDYNAFTMQIREVPLFSDTENNTLQSTFYTAPLIKGVYTGVITTSLHKRFYNFIKHLSCSSTGSVITKNSLLLQLDVK